MRRAAMVLIAVTMLVNGFALSSSARFAGELQNDDEVEGPWLKLPEFDAEIDGATLTTGTDGTVTYRRSVNGGELNLTIERVPMDEITEQKVLDTIARRESVDAGEIVFSDATELKEKFSYEYPCVAAAYETEGGVRDNSELIFPVGEYLFRLIVSIRSDAETDYEADDMITRWISKIVFVGL